MRLQLAKIAITLTLLCVTAFAQQKGSFTDQRDGKRYKTVKIGVQTWMAENLDYAASDSKCYDNISTNCKKYGRLYKWATAMISCPNDWHLPSADEWEILMDFVGGRKVAGTKLKARSGWNYNGYNKKSGNGKDEFGFSALPGGLGNSYDSFNGVGTFAQWWSFSEDSGNSYIWIMDTGGDTRGISFNANLLFSVRCVKD